MDKVAQTVTQTTPKYEVTGVKAGDYAIRVAAVNQAGIGAYTASLTAKVIASTPASSAVQQAVTGVLALSAATMSAPAPKPVGGGKTAKKATKSSSKKSSKKGKKGKDGKDEDEDEALHFEF